MSSADALPSSLISRLPPALAAFLAHLPGLSLAALILVTGTELPGLGLALLIGATAGGVAWIGRLPVWWRAINLVFVPLLWLAVQVEVQAGWYLLAFLLLAATSLGAVFTRVPLYLSSDQAAAELARLLPPGGRFCDLGCGLGGPLARLAALRPDATLHGVEAAPLNWAVSRLRLGRRAQVRLGSLWEADLSGYDLIYAYLSPAPMARLWDKAQREMRSGSLFVSNSFEVPGLAFDEVIELDDLSRSRLLIRRMR